MGGRRQLSDKKLLSLGLECSRVVSNNEIMKAKKKPKGVSDIRWRIELRRRANSSYYSKFGEAVSRHD